MSNLVISDYTTESENKSGQNLSHPQGGDFRDAQEKRITWSLQGQN